MKSHSGADKKDDIHLRHTNLTTDFLWTPRQYSQHVGMIDPFYLGLLILTDSDGDIWGY